ncbi:MAG: exonuclease SbcCD subunit D C-terminal domain-containing protein [Thiolinea sp.]
MKILHTSDWHLGHQLHGYSRDYEHQAFLDWLTETLEQQAIDALLVAGDIFDSANPPASAWRMLYRFLATLAQRLPQLDVVLIGGNHDSPSKLDAPHELLKAFDLNIVGGIHRDANGQLDHQRMLVPLTDQSGSTTAWVMAVPFLRSADLQTDNLEADDDRLIKGVETLYAEMTAAARNAKTDQQALIAMGHAYMASGTLSEMSERRVLGGNQHALPASIFADDVSYVALGHLHLAQRVAKQEHIRYCGSPIPLSMSERDYKHQALVVELDGPEVTNIEPLFIPCCVGMLSIPAHPAPLDEVLQALEQLETEDYSPEQQPFLEVNILLDKPQALLREKILQALEGKAVRLTKINPHYRQQENKNTLQHQRLADVNPEQVFILGWTKKYQDEPDQTLQKAFAELLLLANEDESIETTGKQQ